MTRARLALPLLLGAAFGAFLGIVADARQVIVPFANARLAADGTGALAAVSAGPCGTLGPITNGAQVRVAADSTGALSICGSFGGAGSGSVTTIEENNVQLGGADIIVIDFLGADFDLTESPDTEVNVVIAAAITRDAEWDTSAEIATAVGDETGSGALMFATSPTVTTSIILGAAGVSITDDADGAITLLGLGNGSDENLTLNFDDTANAVVVTTSTGVTTITFTSIDLTVPAEAYGVGWDSDNTVPTKNDVYDKIEASGAGATAYDDIGDPDANGSIAFAGFTNAWTSTLDNGIAFEITDTDADAAADTILLKLSHNDGADANVIFLQLIGDKDGTPATVFQVSETAASFTVDLTIPDEDYDSTGWNGDMTAPTKDSVRDILETFVTITDANDGDHILFLDDSAGSVVKLTHDLDSLTITGTTMNVVRRYDYKGAVCQNATASLGFSTPVSNPATAACVTGTNTQFGVAQFTNANALSMQDHFRLPTVFNSLAAQIKWRTSATSGDVHWQIATICVADAETSDPAFNTASTVTDTAKGTTLQQNDATIATVTTTGCAAGEELYFKILRDQADAADTLAATADLISITFLVR